MSKHYLIPDGGCIKETEGTFTQVFDKHGNMIDSGFCAGDQCDYLDEHDNDIDDDRMDFYHPFNTAPTNTSKVLADLVYTLENSYIGDIGLPDEYNGHDEPLKDAARDIIKHLEG